MCFLLLASSRTASLVCLAPALPSLYDDFSLCLGVCRGMSLSICLPSFHSSSLCLARVSLPPCGASSCIFPLLSSHNLQKYFPFNFSFAIVCSLFVCHWILTCNCPYFGDSSGDQSGLKCTVCMLFESLNFVHLRIYGFTCFLLVFGFSASLCFEFYSVSFKLHFPSVMSCMCMVFSRPQWKTSWKRRCQRKEDAGGFHGGAGTATINQ